MRMRPRRASLVLPLLASVVSMVAGDGGSGAQTRSSGDVIPTRESPEGLRAVLRGDAPGEVRRVSTRSECPPGDRVQLNLTAWKASLKRAETRERRDELLRELALSLSPGDPESSDGPEDVAVVDHGDAILLGIDDSPVHLEPGRFPDHVIDVRFQIQTPSGKEVAHLIQVLRPLGAPEWCRLGIDLSRREGEDSRLDTFALGFVPLLNAKTKAIEVQVVDSRLRHNETTRQYWVTEGFRLAKVFDQQIGSMENADSGRETTAKIGKLALIGDFPKRIELKQVTKRVVCVTVAEDVPCSESDGSSVTTFVYDGRRYVRRK